MGFGWMRRSVSHYASIIRLLAVIGVPFASCLNVTRRVRYSDSS